MSYCKTCDNERGKCRHRRNKVELIKYKGGACEHCGGVFHPVLYDFHHRNPKEKEFEIGNKRLELPAVQQELDKCLLLCVSCHRMVHYND